MEIGRIPSGAGLVAFARAGRPVSEVQTVWLSGHLGAPWIRTRDQELGLRLWREGD